MIKPIDEFLNSTTMYKLVLYGLLFLSIAAILFSALELVAYSPSSLILTLFIFVSTCHTANKFLSWILRAPSNVESSVITALILFLVVSPVEAVNDLFGVLLISAIAIASKYVLAVRRRHIFNPAAIAIFLTGIIGVAGASWWIASPAMAVPALLVGLLVVKKLRRFLLLLTFVSTALLGILLHGFFADISITRSFYLSFTAWPLLFLGAIMLTEPQTSPTTKKAQIIYGLIVGFLFSSEFRFGVLSSSPELALVIGNIYSYAVGFKQKIALTLDSIQNLSVTIYNFTFTLEKKISFRPGQYLELTLPHKNPDSRGIRRFFSIASSPTEKKILVGTRIESDRSSFKEALLNLHTGERVSAGSLSGEFVLPKDKQERLVLIAGGVGITPYRSMLKYLNDAHDKRDIILFYVCKRKEDFVYKEILSDAEKKLGIKIVYIVNKKDDATSLDKRVGDYHNKKFYISGSPSFVDNYKNLLVSKGVHEATILTDHFSGY